MKIIIRESMPFHQRGAASLLISLVLLTVITFVSLYTSRTVLMEQKISSNEFRSRIAFESAEAGAEDAIAYLNGGWDRNEDGNVDFIYDTNADGLTDSNSSDVTVTLPDPNDPNSTVTVTTGHVDLLLTNVSVGGVFAINIEATGRSPDGSASRTINQVIARVPGIPNVPSNPLLTKGAIVVNGAAQVKNPQGASTIWSGSSVDLGSNNATHTLIADPNDTTNYPNCLGGSVACDTVNSSDRYTAGLDVIENDDSLNHLNGDEFFKNFFGTEPKTYHDSRDVVDVAGANVANDFTDDPPGINLATEAIVWVDGSAGSVKISGGTVGCEVAVTGANVCPTNDIKPSIVIIDGDVNFTGNPKFYGLLYITGNVTSASGGTLSVTGAMVVQGDNVSTKGNINITYNTDVLSRSSDTGPLGGGGGSWRDFE